MISKLSGRIAWFVALLVLAVLGWRLPAARAGSPTTAPSAEFAGRTVEDVRILGNEGVSTAVIRNMVRTRVGQPFDPATFADDYQRIFSLRKFSNVEAQVEATSTGVIAIFHVTEPRQITAVHFRGNVHMDDKALRGAIDLQPGQAVDTFRISLARTAVEKLYRDHNYAFARVGLVQDELVSKGIVLLDITEGPLVRVRKVEFQGNRSYTSDKLLDQVKTRSYIWVLRAGTYDAQQVNDDVASLRQFYERQGFFDARIGRKLIFSADQSEMMVVFLIEEGLRYRIEHIVFRGNAGVSEARLRQDLHLTEGRSYDSDILQRDVRQIVRAYGPLGYVYVADSNNPDYLHVDAHTRFYSEPGKVDLVYDIHEGRPFHIGRIIVRGNAKIQDKVFVREMRVVPGQLYDSYQIESAADRIRSSRLVSNVAITPIGDDPQVRDVLVEVNESQTAFVMFGAGITSSAGIVGNISYEQRNFDITNLPPTLADAFSQRYFTGAGQYFKVSLEPGTKVSAAEINFQDPWVFDQPYSLGVNLYYTTWQRESWNEVRGGGRLTLGKRFNDEWSGHVFVRGEVVGITQLSSPIEQRALEILTLTGYTPITSAGFDIHRSDIDSPNLPSRGSDEDFSYECAGLLGGDYNFQKYTLDFGFHQLMNEDLLDRKTTLTERGSVGYITGGVPFFEALYAGGMGSVRGFRYRGISPRSGIANDPIGGKFSAVGTVELNFPLAGDILRGVVFTDAGTVEPNVSVGTIRASVGFGVRITLPFLGQLPVAVDFGFPMAKSSQDTKEVLSFSLGFGQ